MENAQSSLLITNAISAAGLGSLRRFPLEIRENIYRYVLDINLQLSEYLKGVEKYQNTKCRVKGQRIRIFTCENLFIRVQLPRRTNILLVSKAINEEALRSMFRENRFVLTSDVPHGYSTFNLLPLKEDFAFHHEQLTSENRYSYDLRLPYHKNIPIQNIRPRLLESIRFLVLNFCTPAISFGSSGYYSTALEPPLMAQFFRMLNFIETFSKIHCLRINVHISTCSGTVKVKMLKRVEQLSQLRGILKLEVRGAFKWGLRTNLEGQLEHLSTLPECRMRNKYYYLTKDYHEYLEDVSRNNKGTEVEAFGRKNVLTINQSGNSDEDGGGLNEQTRKVYPRTEEDNSNRGAEELVEMSGLDDIEKALATGQIAWWYKR